MPGYNCANTVKKAVRSTLKALGPEDILLFRDDGSSDNTVEIVSTIQDSRLRVSQNSKNMGLSRTLNSMLAGCDGELIARMDADDVCLPWRFFFQRRAISSPHVDFIFSTIILKKNVGPLGLPLPMPTSRLSHADIQTILPISCVLAHPTALMRGTAIRNLGGWPECGQEDYVLWLHALREGYKFRRLAVPALIYTMAPNSLSRSPRHLNQDTLRKVDEGRLGALSDGGAKDIDNLSALRRANAALQSRVRRLAWLRPLLRAELGIFSRWRKIGQDFS